MKITETKLFKGIDISKFDYEIIEYKQNSIMFEEGTKCHNIGVILEGSLNVKSHTINGDDFFITELYEDMLFGDVLVFSNNDYYLGDIISSTNIKVALIEYNKFLDYLHIDNTLVNNFLSILATKAFNVNNRLKLLTQPTLRDKINLYLKNELVKSKTNTISINITRDRLASILSVTRPSLCRELSNMKKENIIDYDKYTITIKKAY